MICRFQTNYRSTGPKGYDQVQRMGGTFATCRSPHRRRVRRRHVAVGSARHGGHGRPRRRPGTTCPSTHSPHAHQARRRVGRPRSTQRLLGGTSRSNMARARRLGLARSVRSGTVARAETEAGRPRRRLARRHRRVGRSQAPAGRPARKAASEGDDLEQ